MSSVDLAKIPFDTVAHMGFAYRARHGATKFAPPAIQPHHMQRKKTPADFFARAKDAFKVWLSGKAFISRKRKGARHNRLTTFFLKTVFR